VPRAPSLLLGVGLGGFLFGLSDPRLADVDFDELAARAQSQRRRLERQRLRAAEEDL
jgi:hypothetical protein